MRRVRLPDGRVWLRVADPDWVDPLDPKWAGQRGGRWNAPGAHPSLYLNADLVTACRQVERLLAGSPVLPDDLDDGAYVLVAATLPRDQMCADAVSVAGLRALGLSSSYPRTATGDPVANEVCHAVGARVREAGLRGVWCRSAFMVDGAGRELAWFPATSRSRAHPVWPVPLAYGAWRHASTWADLGFGDQPEPGSAAD